jgi:hypothetical protein
MVASPVYNCSPEEGPEPTSMAKLLSNSYEREWHEKMAEWKGKQDEGKKTVLAPETNSTQRPGA